MKGKRKAEVKRLDALWSKAVIERDGRRCRYCKQSGNQPHHIFSRRHRSTRWDVDNGITLCWHHHFHLAHGEPEMFREFLLKEIGEEMFEALKRRAWSRAGKTDYALVQLSLASAVR